MTGLFCIRVAGKSWSWSVRPTDRDGAVGMVDEEIADTAKDCPADLAHAPRPCHYHDSLLLFRNATDHFTGLPSRRPEDPRQLQHSITQNIASHKT